jgi:hypothetical protein
MPLFSIENPFTSNADHHVMSLQVEMLAGEDVLDDSVIHSMSDWMKQSPYIAFTRHWYPTNDNSRRPIKIRLTSECLGSLNPKGIFFRCLHDGVTDELFSKCNRLQFLTLGTSVEPIILEYPEHISKQPLKLIETNWSGRFLAGKPFWDFIEKGRKSGQFKFTYWT